MLLDRQVIPVLSALLALSGCGDDAPSVDSGRKDIGEDSLVRDVPSDPSTDQASEDTLQDRRNTDGGGEEVRWVPLGGLPDDCVIERAENPEAVFDNRWEPCQTAEGLPVADCQSLVEDPRYQRSVDASVGFARGGVAYFSVVERPLAEPEGRRHRIVVLADSDGAVHAAWRGPDPGLDGVCIVGRPTTNGERAAFSLLLTGDGEFLPSPVYASPLANLSSSQEPSWVLGDSELPGENMLQYLATSPSTLVLQVVPAGYLLVLQGDTVGRLSHSGSPVEGFPVRIHVVEDHVLWMESGGTVAHGTIDNEGGTYIARPAAQVRGFSTDGETVVWQEWSDPQPDGSWGQVELYAAPYQRNPEDLEPRLVRSLPIRLNPATLGAGVYGSLTSRDPTVFRFYDLADGRERQLPTETSFGATNNPIAITDTEVLLKGSRGRLRRYGLSAIPYVD